MFNVDDRGEVLQGGVAVEVPEMGVWQGVLARRAERDTATNKQLTASGAHAWAQPNVRLLIVLNERRADAHDCRATALCNALLQSSSADATSWALPRDYSGWGVAGSQG